VLHTPVCDALGITHPICQAGMANYTSPELVAAVSNAGGLGVHGSVGRDPAELRQILRATRELVGDRPFGVNHVVQWFDEAAFDVCLEEGVPVFCFSWGDPGDRACRAHEAGAKVICQVTHLSEVEPALAAGADVIVAQGTEAGGHSGFVPLIALLPAVVEAARSVPVLAALAMGAAGGWLGTRFLATPDAWASKAWKQAIVTAGPSDTVHTEAFDVLWGRRWDGARVRAIRNDFTDAWHGREAALAARHSEVQEAVWRAEREDNPRLIALMAGVGAGAIRDLRPAGDLVRDITAEAESVVARLRLFL